MKYVIIILVIVLGFYAIVFLLKSRDSLNQQIIDIGSDVATPGTPKARGEDDKDINNQDNRQMIQAILKTSEGEIEIEFLREQAPKTVENFANLAGDGFYDGTKFHRVIAGFMIQGGDPLTKDDSRVAEWGTGGPGYAFADEISNNNENNAGTIAMANSGPNTNGSQFFINVADNNFLDSKHTVFGKVTGGMDVVKKIENTATSGEDRPLTAVVIESITLK